MRYPLLFNLLYNQDNIAADAIYDRVRATEPLPSDQVSGRQYTGQYIIIEPEGIYSPLLPHVAIDLQRLVVLAYNSTTDKVTVLDEIPQDVIDHGNIIIRTKLPLKTNYQLINVAQD